jgi:hypothetical protein
MFCFYFALRGSKPPERSSEPLRNEARESLSFPWRSSAPIGGREMDGKTLDRVFGSHFPACLYVTAGEMKYWDTKVFESFTEGESKVTQKRRTIQLQKGVVTDLMKHLAELPECEKGPGNSVSLSEVFRTKEYVAEIRGALKKGYTFEDLAKIFTEKCGIAVSTRQIKYHYTRGRNRGMKNPSGRKSGDIDAQKEHASSKNPPRKDTSGEWEKNLMATERSLKTPGIVSGNRVTMNAVPGTFPIDMNQGEI